MIGMTGFDREPADLRDAQIAAAARVVDSHHFVLGPEVQSFEATWAAMCGSAHAIGVANGLDAIEIVLRSLGIGPGDEVITTPMTAFATVLAIIRAGATPVLADIDPRTALLSMDSSDSCIGPRTRAVLLVHLYGQARDVDSWATFCDSKGITLIEDCAQSHLAVSGGRPAGSFGPMAAYSFYPTKNLGAIGDAGAVVTNDAQLAAKARQLRNYGQAERYEHVSLGLNSRLDEMQAAILSERSRWLAAFTNRRREVADRYFSEINNQQVTLLSAPRQPEEHVFHQFVLNCNDRDALAGHLAGHGVSTLVHYPVPMHRQPALAGVAIAEAGLAAAERHARTCLSIPCHPQLTDDEVTSVVDAVNSFRPT